MRPLDEHLGLNPANIYARAANTNLVTFSRKELQHALDIVVSIGGRLTGESTGYRIANEKHRYPSLFVFGRELANRRPL